MLMQKGSTSEPDIPVGVTADSLIRRAGFKHDLAGDDEAAAHHACERLKQVVEEEPISRRIMQQVRAKAVLHMTEAGMQRRNAEAVIAGTFGVPMKATEMMLDLTADLVPWHDQDGRAFVTIFRDGHDEHYASDSDRLRDWLSHQYYLVEQQAPAPVVLSTVLRTIEGRARYEGDQHHSWARVGAADGKLYVDLGDPSWDAIEITPGEGWRVISNPPVRFYRPNTMRPLPRPEPGTVKEFDEFFNFSTPADRMLYIGAMVAAFRTRGPYLIISVQGRQGSAKSTTSRAFVRLTDPHAAPLRSMPRNEEDLALSALHASVLGFDNLDRVPSWFSDALCRLSTGGGFATRRLFTNTEEVVIEPQATVVLNGIVEVIERPDALDRALVFNLPRIDDSDRRREDEFWKAFDAAEPRLLGALLNGVSAALARVGTIQFDRLPRMADAVAFAAAAGAELGWTPEEYIAAYRQNQDEAVLTTLDHDPVGSAIWELVDSAGEYAGTASELLACLNGWVSADVRREPGWPRAANSLSAAVSRVEPSLRRVGIAVERSKSSDRESRRLLRLVRVAPGPLRVRKECAPGGAGIQQRTASTSDANRAPRPGGNLLGRVVDRFWSKRVSL